MRTGATGDDDEAAAGRLHDFEPWIDLEFLQ
jgi:hypothetical protein